MIPRHDRKAYLYAPKTSTIFKALESNGDEPERKGWIVSRRSSTQPKYIEKANSKKLMSNIEDHKGNRRFYLTYRGEIFLIEGARTSKLLDKVQYF